MTVENVLGEVDKYSESKEVRIESGAFARGIRQVAFCAGREKERNSETHRAIFGVIRVAQLEGGGLSFTATDGKQAATCVVGQSERIGHCSEVEVCVQSLALRRATAGLVTSFSKEQAQLSVRLVRDSGVLVRNNMTGALALVPRSPGQEKALETLKVLDEEYLLQISGDHSSQDFLVDPDSFKKETREIRWLGGLDVLFRNGEGGIVVEQGVAEGTREDACVSVQSSYMEGRLPRDFRTNALFFKKLLDSTNNNRLFGKIDRPIQGLCVKDRMSRYAYHHMLMDYDLQS